jgi:hypothetical protein
MKHLKKYNENKQEDFNIEYFNDCFIEFIDSGSWSEIGDDYGDGRTYYEIIINLPGVHHKDGIWSFKKENTLSGNLKYAEELVEFYKEIENCIEKVKIKYPNIEIDFNIEKEDNDAFKEGLFDAYVILALVQGKNIINKPMKKGLNTINFSELDNTWDIRPEN